MEAKTKKREGNNVSLWMTDEELDRLDKKVSIIKKIIPAYNRSDHIRMLISNTDLEDILPRLLQEA